ncbi:MAG TPA: hypothetical protein VFO70_01285 [Chitinophagaceae bacterium]|nr:hypothetical protein [Chitinophagaceae bacterium]
MKIITAIISFLLLGLIGSAQSGSWRIKLNKKVLLSTSTESENKNVRFIKRSDWQKNGFLEINFKETEPEVWKRSFLFVDEADNQLLSKDSVTHAKIKISTLRKIFAGKKEIRIYTIVAPLDPNLAIRIRRVHLCTLRLP